MKTKITFSSFEKDGNGIPCKDIIRNPHDDSLRVIGYIKRIKTGWTGYFWYHVCTSDWLTVEVFTSLKDAEKYAKKVFIDSESYNQALIESFDSRRQRIIKNAFTE